MIRIPMIVPTLFVLAACSLMAQEPDGLWFAGVGGGIAALDYEAFSDRLASYNPVADDGVGRLYHTGSIPYTSWTLDLSAGVMLGEHLVVDATGSRLFTAELKSANSTDLPSDIYQLSAVGGGIDIGWVLLHTDMTILFPYIQGGYYGWSLDYTNNQSDSIPFFEGISVAPGQTATYTGAAPRIAIGVALVRFFGGGSSGSFIAPAMQIRLAWGSMISRPQWKEPNGDLVTNGGLTPGYNGVTLSLQIGGGGGW